MLQNGPFLAFKDQQKLTKFWTPILVKTLANVYVVVFYVSRYYVICTTYVSKNTSKCNEMFLILLPGGAKNRRRTQIGSSSILILGMCAAVG